MQSAPRLARTAVRQAAQTPTTVSTSTSSPFVTTHLYSLHSEHAPLFQRIQQHPEVLDAIENMARVTRDKTGVDLAAGQKPSMMMMLQLARCVCCASDTVAIGTC